MKNYINYILEALTLVGFFTTFYLLTLIFNNMKSKQFEHNLKKHKRQQASKRGQTKHRATLQLVKDFGKIYLNNK
jgi:hypothetical protein